MGPSFDDIRTDFVRLRDFILHDIEVFVSQPVGGNFGATALILCACEAIAQARDGNDKGGNVFRELLDEVPWGGVSTTIYLALRDGLVHFYDAKKVVIDEGREFRFGLSWSEAAHLSSNADADLILNVREMAKRLRGVFEKFEERLQTDEGARSSFRNNMRKERQSNIPGNETPAWRAILAGQ